MKKMALLVTLFAAMNIQADEIYHSSLLELESGFIGENLGVEVTQIVAEEKNQLIELDLPDLTGEIQTLKLVDEKNAPITTFKRYEVMRDHDNNPTGVMLYMDKRHKKPFKIIYEVNENE